MQEDFTNFESPEATTEQSQASPFGSLSLQDVSSLNALDRKNSITSEFPDDNDLLSQLNEGDKGVDQTHDTATGDGVSEQPGGDTSAGSPSVPAESPSADNNLDQSDSDMDEINGAGEMSSTESAEGASGSADDASGSGSENEEPSEESGDNSETDSSGDNSDNEDDGVGPADESTESFDPEGDDDSPDDMNFEPTDELDPDDSPADPKDGGDKKQKNEVALEPYQDPNNKEKFFDAMKEAEKITDPTEKTKALKSALAGLFGTKAEDFAGLTGPGSVEISGKDGKSAFVGYNHGFGTGVLLKTPDSTQFLDLRGNKRVEVGNDGQAKFDPPSMSRTEQFSLLAGATIATDQAAYKYTNSERSKVQTKALLPHVEKLADSTEKFDAALVENKHGTRDHPDMAQVKDRAAEKLFDMGETGKALDKWKEALAIQEKFHPGHKNIESNKEFLDKLQKQIDDRDKPAKQTGRSKVVSNLESATRPRVYSEFKNIRDN